MFKFIPLSETRAGKDMAARFIAQGKSLGIVEGKVEGKAEGKVESSRQFIIAMTERKLGVTTAKKIAKPINKLPAKRLETMVSALLDAPDSTKFATVLRRAQVLKTKKPALRMA